MTTTGTGPTFQLTEEQQSLRDAARGFAADVMRPAGAVHSIEQWKRPDSVIRQAAELGLTTFLIPEQYGGGGCDPVTGAILNEELAWGDAGLATLLCSTHLFAGGILAAPGLDEAMRDKWLSLMCRDGGAIGAIAFSEPHAGSDVANIRTRAVRDGDDWVISGEKTWITGGGIADATIIFARTSDDGAHGITAFVVEGDAQGMSHQKLDLVGLKSSYTASIFLDEVRVPDAHRLGNVGEGFAVAMGFFAHSRPQVAASAVGIARAAFEYAVQYAREREAFGKPIVANQGVSFMLAQMGMRVEAARLLTWRAADLAARGEDVGLAGSYAKLAAADTAMDVATDAVQILGGAGLSVDHPVERFMRDAKVLQIVEGTSQIQHLIIARYLAAGTTSLPD